jgi:uncharacterized protein YecE (DUF72 family)
MERDDSKQVHGALRGATSGENNRAAALPAQKSRTLLVATAGWSVPRSMRQLGDAAATVLENYAHLLGATEINSTFYRRHRVSTFERWRASVPPSFRFAVKLPKRISHEAALVGVGAELDAFLDDVRGLGDQLGPLLVQLPASFHFEGRRVSSFLRALRRRFAGPVACEPRHASWYTVAATRVFTDYGVSRVVADPPRPLAAVEPAGEASLLYVRWHGAPDIYWSAYSDESLSRLAQLVNEQADASSVWCVFDNTAAGAALNDALRFRALIGG